MRFGAKQDRRKPEQITSDLIPVMIVVTTLSLLVFCSLVGYLVLFSGNSVQAVPISLHSVLMADYQVDPHSAKLQPVQLSLIQEALEDQLGQGSAERYATIEFSLITPVPTITPRFDSSSVPTLSSTSYENTATPAGNPSRTPSASLTLQSPVFTQTPTVVQLLVTPSATLPASILTPTRVSTGALPTTTPGNYPTPTPTRRISTATHTAIIVTQQTPTSTPYPTPTRTPTSTLVPPTPRPTNTPNPYPGPSPDPYP